jgi:hypothetical protein
MPVPNHLEVEDTFLIGLTMRQWLLLFIGAVTSYLLFLNLLAALPDPRLATFGGAAVALLFFTGILLLALVRIGGRWMEEWGLVCLLYLARPRVFLWRFQPLDGSERRAVRRRARKQATDERQQLEESPWE